VKPLRPLFPGSAIWSDDVNAAWTELARLSKLDVDGGDVEEGAGGRLLRIPRLPARYVVRVYAEDGGSGGSGSGSGSGGSDCDVTSYRWTRQLSTQCGEWVDETPIALTGSTDNHNPAFNPNGGEIADGTVVEITRGAAYIDDAGTPVQEWVIVAVVGGDQPLARVVGDGPVDRLCGPGWGSGDLSCPNFLDPPAGPIYDADLVTPPRRVPHPTLVDVLVYTDFEAVKPIWLLQPNGGRWPFGVLPRDNIYLTRRLVAEAVCVCGETRPMYVTDDAGAAQVSGFWAILTDSPCGGSGSGAGSGSGSGSGGCNRTGYGWILATTDGAGNWTPFAGVTTLGATYGTTTDYPALEVNDRLPTLSADPPTVVWLRPTPGANPDCPTFSFEWQSAPAACPGACVRTREVTFSYTKDDGMGGCCTETTTITLPVDVDVCVTPCGGSGGSGG
jgi:hypothetical protein